MMQRLIVARPPSQHHHSKPTVPALSKRAESRQTEQRSQGYSPSFVSGIYNTISSWLGKTDVLPKSSTFDTKSDEFAAGAPNPARSDEYFNEVKHMRNEKDTPDANSWGTSSSSKSASGSSTPKTAPISQQEPVDPTVKAA